MADSSSERHLLLLHHLTLHSDGPICKHCDFQFSVRSGSSSWKKHLENRHPTRAGELREQQAEAASKKKTLKRSAAEAALDPSTPTSSSRSPTEVASSVVESLVTSGKQSKLTEWGNKNKWESSLKALAVTFACNSIAHAVVETPSFKQLFTAMGWPSPPSRDALRSTMMDLARSMRSNISGRLRNAVVTIAADGWTNVKREKITNIVPIVGGVAMYWSSIVNTGENNAKWLEAQLRPTINTLINDHGARVIGLVVDNEAVNAAAYDLLLPHFPFLIHVPCAAHTVQLIVRSCLMKSQLQPVVSQLGELVRHFDAKANRISLRQIQEARGKPFLAVLKPCDTRWSSLLIAAERMLRMQDEVVTCYNSRSLPSIEITFWFQLEVLVEFLKPFRIATDVIQRNSATLFTVHQQFLMLREHAKQHPWCLECIENRWKHRINVEAVTASAILSFVEPSSDLNKVAAIAFIVSMGSEFLFHYKLCGTLTKQQIGDELGSQLADFNGRDTVAKAGIFYRMPAQIESAKRASAKSGHWQPHKVWLLYPDVSLATVAMAILSVSASEAAVERTFSAQGLVHSKRRNSLHSATVEAEMMLKFNSRAVAEGPSAEFGSCRELKVEVEESEDEEDAATGFNLPAELVLEEAEPQLAEIMGMEMASDASESSESEVEEDSEEPPASAAAAANLPAPPTSVQRRALKLQRTMSSTFTTEDLDEYIAWFIGKKKLTKNSKLDPNMYSELSNQSCRLSNCPAASTLEHRLRQALKSL